MVSRSNEVKAMGIPMGAPAWKWRDAIRQNKITLFSGNFALYGDFSRRVMAVIEQFSESYEQYSIDEAFLEVQNFSHAQLLEYAHDIRNTILQWTGIPVSIGVGPTKTLAKVANHLAKTNEKQENVFALCTQEEIQRGLEKLPVRKVWGVGWSMERYLADYSITTAKQLADTPDAWLKKHLHNHGLNLAWELRGISCGGVEGWEPRKGILSSRSFGEPVTTRDELRQAVAHHISYAAEKLRDQGSAARHLHVFIMTNRFKPGEPQYSGGRGAKLLNPTAHTPTLIAEATRLLDAAFKPGVVYKKAGVWLTDLVPEDRKQASLLPGGMYGGQYTERQQRLMRAHDSVNAKWGDRTVYPLAVGINQRWRAKQNRRSPRYTTVWDELPRVHA
jgi:DNA polymerase V